MADSSKQSDTASVSGNQVVASGETSDGYHTFNELYAHRTALFIALMKSNLDISWRSSPGGGWFLAGMFLPTGHISYHIPEERWRELHPIKVLAMPPWYDGYTPADVVARLNAWNPDKHTEVTDLPTDSPETKSKSSEAHK